MKKKHIIISVAVQLGAACFDFRNIRGAKQNSKENFCFDYLCALSNLLSFRNAAVKTPFFRGRCAFSQTEGKIFVGGLTSLNLLWPTSVK